MNNTAIFWPVIILALLTLYLYIPMINRRIASVKSGEVKAGIYRLVENEPPAVRQLTRTISNQYETPILFYAVVVSAYVTQNAGTLMLVLAWAYVALKCAHVFVQSTSNNLRYRRPLFTAAYAVLTTMWIAFAFSLSGWF